jgi:hypothetical protein
MEGKSETPTTRIAGWWCVVYTGAPYGLDEAGEVVSRHRTEEAALEALRRSRRVSSRLYGSNGCVRFVTR